MLKLFWTYSKTRKKLAHFSHAMKGKISLILTGIIRNQRERERGRILQETTD